MSGTETPVPLDTPRVATPLGAAHGDDPWRRYRTPWRIVGSIIAVLLLLGGVARVVGVLADREVRVDEVVDPVGRDALVVELPNSRVEVVGADVEVVTVRGSSTSGLRERGVEVDVEGDRIVVSMECHDWLSLGDCGADLRVEVPRSLAVEIDAPNSELTLRDLDAAVRARSSNTDLVAVGLGGPTVLETSNSSITATAMRSADVELLTSNDRVRLEFIEPPRSAVVRTSNDAVEVVLPDTADFYDVRLQTSNGRSSSEVRSDPDSDRLVQVDTSNDDVVVRYPD